MLENAQQRTIKPLIKATICTRYQYLHDEYDIYGRLEQWGYLRMQVSVTAVANMLMRTVMAFMKCTSTPWGFGHC